MAHRLLVGPNDLTPYFDTATIARGVRYASEGRVHDVYWEQDGRTVEGRCYGSRDYIYDPAVCFARGGGIEWADCSCPVGDYCKHAVALVLAAASGGRQPTDWRTVVTSLLDETPAPAVDTGSAVGLQFSLVAPTLYQPGETIAVRPVTIGKRGTWIKSGLSWQRLLYDSQSGRFNRSHYQAVRALVVELQRSGMAIYGSAPLTLTGVSQALWPKLADAEDAGVAMVAERSSGLQTVEFVKNAALRLDFTADKQGGATMSVRLVVDGEQYDPRGVGLIGRTTPHGMYKVTEGVLRLGAFDPIPGRAMLDLIGRDEQVHIPAENIDEFSLQVLPRLANAVAVEIEEGLFAPPIIAGPAAVLTVKMTDSGARAYWSTRYDVNDKHHEFDPDSPPRLSAYRDAAAEDAIWQQVTPSVRAVAAASHDYKQQAAQHVRRRINRIMNAATMGELRAIDAAGDSGAAAAAASLATLRCAVDLTAAEAAVLCGEVLPALDCAGALVVEIDEAAPSFRAAASDPQLQFASDDGQPAHTDWFDLNITVSVDGHSVALSDVITELASGATHMLLTSGVYFRLDTPELLRMRELIDEARALGEIDAGKVNARSLNVTLWEELLALGVVDKQVAAWRSNLARLASARPPVSIEVPAQLRATLRDYQHDGLDWLSFLWDNGLGGVLADDMGLGKTVQTLALMTRAVAEGAGRAGKFLVVAPTSVVGNWVAEARRFTPALTTLAVTATDTRSACPLAELAAGADVVVTSYALFRIDFDNYSQMDWAGLILDEAQFVKNHNGKTHHCVRRLDSKFKLAITGTPMENNLMELWSLLSITVPGLFPSPTAFTDYFRKPIESGANRERLPVLRRRIKPVMLRRTKSQVVTELPPKQEQVLSIGLNAKHRKIYDTRLARERQKVLGLLGDWEKNRFRIFRSLMLLRQLSLHPGLVDKTNINAGSAKVDFLVEQLPQLVAEGHGALVFSQFTGFLGILRSHLDAAGVSYSYLDGSVSAKKRAAAIKQFRDGATPVFLISLKAGGFGLNLTEADYCFLTDPWWSPAAETQAVDRTHRIGQTRPVTVYRLVSANTIEEKVIALQQRKRELFTAVMDEGELFGSAISASDVRELLG
jgi:superfamily II DNA or RNA helicase